MNRCSLLCGMMIVVFVLGACVDNSTTQVPFLDPNLAIATVTNPIDNDPTSPPPLLSTPTFLPTLKPQTLLPNSLYYLAQDVNGKEQIFRLSRDNVTKEITFEQNGIATFDILLADGTIVYSTRNSLVIVDADGENRHTLIQDLGIEYIQYVFWSADGKTIIYGNVTKVMHYNLDTKISVVVFGGNDTEYYWLGSVSPDGKKIIVERREVHSELQVQIYDFTSSTLTPIGQGKINHSCTIGASFVWYSLDSFLCYNYFFNGAPLGLSSVNATDGSLESLMLSDSCSPCLFVAAPQINANGNLYYLYAEANDMLTISFLKFSLIQSSLNDVTNHVMLRPESFAVKSALWSPNGDALLILPTLVSPSESVNLMLVPIDPTLDVLTIEVDASKWNPFSLHWGL